MNKTPGHNSIEETNIPKGPGLSRVLEDNLEAMREKAKHYMWSYEYLRIVLKRYWRISIWLIVIIVISIFVGFSMALRGVTKALEQKKTCTEFSTRAAAQWSFEHGNTALDGDGDHIACESLKK